jgi:anti-anti-sigma factor
MRMPKTHSTYVQARGDLRVVTVVGDLDLRTISALDAAVATAVAARRPAALAVDLTSCSFIDSTGISRLLRIDAAARGQDLAFAVVADPASQPYRVLKLTRCVPNRVLWFESVAAAEAGLARAPHPPFSDLISLN